MTENFQKIKEIKTQIQKAQKILHMGTKIIIIIGFLPQTKLSRRLWSDGTERKQISTHNSTCNKNTSLHESEIKNFSDRQKLRKFITSRHLL